MVSLCESELAEQSYCQLVNQKKTSKLDKEVVADAINIQKLKSTKTDKTISKRGSTDKKFEFYITENGNKIDNGGRFNLKAFEEGKIRFYVKNSGREIADLGYETGLRIDVFVDRSSTPTIPSSQELEYDIRRYSDPFLFRVFNYADDYKTGVKYDYYDGFFDKTSYEVGDKIFFIVSSGTIPNYASSSSTNFILSDNALFFDSRDVYELNIVNEDIMEKEEEKTCEMVGVKGYITNFPTPEYRNPDKTKELLFLDKIKLEELDKEEDYWLMIKGEFTSECRDNKIVMLYFFSDNYKPKYEAPYGEVGDDPNQLFHSALSIKDIKEGRVLMDPNFLWEKWGQYKGRNLNSETLKGERIFFVFKDLSQIMLDTRDTYRIVFD